MALLSPLHCAVIAAAVLAAPWSVADAGPAVAQRRPSPSATPSATPLIEARLLDLVTDGLHAPPRFAFSNDAAHVAPTKTDGIAPDLGSDKVRLDKVVVGMSPKGTTAWIAADARALRSDSCAPEPCPAPKGPPQHATGLLERRGNGWAWLAWHVTAPVTMKQQLALNKQGVAPDPLPRAVAGAEGVVALFGTTIVESTTLAATVSDRNDVVLYGSSASERTVGGAKVRAQLKTWRLGFTVRDGVQAGLDTSKTIAWVAANVDARSAKRPKDKATPYRVLFVYERTGDVWKLVQLHFSVDTATPG